MITAEHAPIILDSLKRGDPGKMIQAAALSKDIDLTANLIYYANELGYDICGYHICLDDIENLALKLTLERIRKVRGTS